MMEILISYAAIITMASLTVYVGARWSLVAKAKSVETVSLEDAGMIPVTGSMVLIGGYLALKYFSPVYVNLLLHGYFVLFGVFTVNNSVKRVVDWVLKQLFGLKRKNWTITLDFTPKSFSFLKFLGKDICEKLPKKSVVFSSTDIVSIMLAGSICLWYAVTKNWIANNVLGLSFAIEGIALLRLGSFSTSVLLLWGLFFYDIFWVFGTNVMVTVAKGFDAPVKILFPRNIFDFSCGFAMLGLGDIVVPGVFLALLLLFDKKKTKSLSKQKQKSPKNENEIFFVAAFFSYVFGLVFTIVVMHLTHSAQPALLYLVPFTFFTSCFVGMYTGQFKALVHFSVDSNSNSKADSSDEQKKR